MAGSLPHRILKLHDGDGFSLFNPVCGGYVFCAHRQGAVWQIVDGVSPGERIRPGVWKDMPHGLGLFRVVEHVGRELKLHYHIRDEKRTRMVVMRRYGFSKGKKKPGAKGVKWD